MSLIWWFWSNFWVFELSVLRQSFECGLLTFLAVVIGGVQMGETMGFES